MAEIMDLEYYKLRAKELPRRRFEQLCLKGRVQNQDHGTQLTVVAALLQHQARMKLEAAAKKITFLPPPDVSKYLFNALNFVLWSMPQENPIPAKIFKKMMKAKQLAAMHLPIPKKYELTDKESRILKEALIWKRGNEDFGIKIVGNVESGIPFGKDRLALIWVITQALQVGEPTIIGFTIKEFLDFFHFDKHGRAYDEAQERFDRLKEANVTVWWTSNDKRFELKCNYLDTALIIRPKKRPARNSDDVNAVTLNLSLWAHLAKENYVWLNLNVVRELKDSPGALDLYQWACAYAFKAKAKTIPLVDLYMQLGMKEDQLPKHKKLSIKRWIDKINNAVNKPGSKGPGTNFTIELQESSRKDRTDLLIIQKSSEYLSTGSRAK